MVAMTQVEFHFDFGSPNCYLAHLVIPGIEERTGAEFVYVPVLLGGVFKMTNNVSPIVANKGIDNKMEYMRLEMKRFLRAHGITRFQLNPHFPVNTLQVMRGAVVAEAEGFLMPYVDAVFETYVGRAEEDGRCRGDPGGARRVRPRRRAYPRALPGAGHQSQAYGEYGAIGCARCVRRARHSSSATRCSSARTGCGMSRR